MSFSRKIYAKCKTSIGEIYIIVFDEKVESIHIGKEDFESYNKNNELDYKPNDPLLVKSVAQIIEYFEGKRKTFDLPLLQNGTAFQLAVWKELTNIPYGETRSYLDIAEKILNPKAVRAIGQANKANLLPIVVPCHRVIGKNQTLTGYAGSRTEIKEKLLDIEGAYYKK